jgi:integrase
MARPATGEVKERVSKSGEVTFALRFRAYGKREYVTLGTKAQGWTRTKAEVELENILADVRRGLWAPPTPEPVESPGVEPTFREFASEWFEANRHEWSERTVKDYRWALELHVLPFFADCVLSEITIELVDQFRAAKLSEAERRRRAIAGGKPERDDKGRVLRPLAPAQINKCIKRVSQIMELAEEYGLVARNPARGKRRKAKEPKVQRTWVEPEQAMSLIEESSPYMRPVVAALIGTGLRVGEAVALDWADVNVFTGTIKVGKAKTDAGSYRELDIPDALVKELIDWKHRSENDLANWKRENPKGGSPVFLTTYAGKVRRQTEANISRRLKTSIKRANVKLAELSIEPISERVTPHSLRRTYASLRAALQDDMLYVSEQMGHKDVRFTLNVYSRAVKRRSKLSGAYLAEFDRALAWAVLSGGGSEKAQTGTNGPLDLSETTEHPAETA